AHARRPRVRGRVLAALLPGGGAGTVVVENAVVRGTEPALPRRAPARAVRRRTARVAARLHPRNAALPGGSRGSGGGVSLRAADHRPRRLRPEPRGGAPARGFSRAACRPGARAFPRG